MFWKFGFASTSSIDTILDKPDVSLEEILDEDDLLQECKSQNSKLIDYLQQPRILKRLLEHVVGQADNGPSQGPDWEEKVEFKYPYVASEVLACDIWAIPETLLSDPKEFLEPFWAAILTWESASLAAPTPHHAHHLFASSFKLPPHLEDAEAKPAEGLSEPTRPPLSRQGSSTRLSDSGPGKGVLAGYWAKVNGFLLDKKPLEMLEFIKGLPFIVERFTAHIETPAVIDLLYRIIQCEEGTPSAGIVDWLADHDLALLLVDLLSPSHSSDIHNNTSELLKAIIALSAPSPATLNQSAELATGMEGAQGTAAGVVNNRIVRELAGEEVVRRMVALMLDAADQEATNESSAEDSPEAQHTIERVASEEEAPRPLNPRDSPASEAKPLQAFDAPGTETENDGKGIRPEAPKVAVTAETRSSSLVTCIGILIELIRKNNSDYFEQHLFHTLRSHLLKRQQEISEQRLQRLNLAAEAKKAPLEDEQEESEDALIARIQEEEDKEEEDEMEGMEEAMAEVSEKLGIVHLGPMLRILCDRLPDFQKLLQSPHAETRIQTTLGSIEPLSFERYRITELYAELLHCSNMALLNRSPGSGPQYSKKGTLMGGIDGLQILARALQGQDGHDSGDQTADEEQADVSAADATFGAEDHGPADKADKPEVSPEIPPSRIRHAREVSKIGTSDSEQSTDESFDPTRSPVETHEATLASSSPEVPASVTPGELVSNGAAENDHDASVKEKASGALYDGDYLKKRFLECGVVSSILDLFFAYPWNNFLHNVVYDILQQFFNGRMNATLNKDLTVSVFTTGQLVQKIIQGHKTNQESMEGPRRIRLGYMGHLNLIAEETVKLLERYPEEIGKAVQSSLPHPEWDELLEELQKTRQKESAPLAGGRPHMGAGMSLSVNGQAMAGSDESAFASYLSSQIGNPPDDDDSDEEASWIAARMTRENSDDSNGFDDAFQPGEQKSGEVDEFEDDWGPFAGSSSDPPAAAETTLTNPFGQNLTSADWAAEFHREAAAAGDAEIDTGSSSRSETPSPLQTAADDPFVDLFDPDFKDQDPTVSLGPSLTTSDRERRASSTSTSSTDASAAAQAVDDDQPLGPGVDPASTGTTDDGRLVRKIDDGLGGHREVAVPLDDVALAAAAEEADEKKEQDAPSSSSTVVAHEESEPPAMVDPPPEEAQKNEEESSEPDGASTEQERSCLTTR